ncbi:MAG: 16S rRNA (guanine(527)-N(7))-methyltransferase RsmG [Terriglobia bacterium]
MDFEDELNELAPPDVPNRAEIVMKCAAHLRMIVEVNASMNLTRITTPREAAIKHVADSLVPWRLFADAKQVLDAGTGAGFPGIPLAIALPEIRFTLTDSTGKKARFVESVAGELRLGNVAVSAQRGEDLCGKENYDLITARAVAPVSRLVGWLAPAIRRGAVALLYKGPDAASEIEEAANDLKRHKVRADVALRYSLPDGLGDRSMVRLILA